MGKCNISLHNMHRPSILRTVSNDLNWPSLSVINLAVFVLQFKLIWNRNQWRTNNLQHGKPWASVRFMPTERNLISFISALHWLNFPTSCHSLSLSVETVSPHFTDGCDHCYLCPLWAGGVCGGDWASQERILCSGYRHWLPNWCCVCTIYKEAASRRATCCAGQAVREYGLIIIPEFLKTLVTLKMGLQCFARGSVKKFDHKIAYKRI